MDLVAELTGHRLLAIVRGRDADASYRALVTLAEEGVRLMEVSLSGADAAAVLRRAAGALGPDVRLGAGTVLSVEDARLAADAGVDFVVSPALGPGIEYAAGLGLPCLPGALTPTEVTTAWRAGAPAVKVFPASVFGPSYVRALGDPLPQVPLVPVGGVSIEDMAAYLAAGAIAVGVGSPLLGDAPHGGDLGALRQRVREALDAVAEFRP
jgi:2-dehydro-3-deoxyphosphogluconate aldolase/(4S)-4-hydroxy-2-oxoglutarate aldolase